jgi:cytoskeletal protein RodZ
MDRDESALGLTTIRRNRGVTLEQISATTKIGVRTLQAIEVGDFGKLPGGIYNTNYIRQYAQAIDFDPGTLLAYYYQKTGVGPAQTGAGQANGGTKDNFGGFRPSAILGRL